MNSFIEVQNAEMVFATRKGRFHALHDINLTVQKGEFVTLIGHSGCGKSTLLNLVAGLTVPTAGTLLCDNREIAAPGPERAVVFQNHSLLPWLTCLENVHLAVERVFGANETKAQLVARSKAALALVGMDHALTKRPHEISGGMKQRVGIARALAMEPKVLLLDEPFGALDALTREEMTMELLRIWGERPKTVLFVTHSITEAVVLADRVVVMSPRPGRIAEIIDVKSPRPRSFHVEGNGEFHDASRRIRELIFGRKHVSASRAAA